MPERRRVSIAIGAPARELGLMSAVGSRGRTIFVADATSRRFALAANCLDRLARFFQNSMLSNGSRIRRRTFPR